jgi:hypothetical protein
VPASISMLVFMAMPSSIRGYARGVVKYIADSTSRRKRVCPGDERDRSPGRRWPAAAHTVADRDLGTRDPPTAISLSGQWAFRCGLARTSVASTSILVLVTNGGFPPFSATQPSHWEWLFLPLKRPSRSARELAQLDPGPLATTVKLDERRQRWCSARR